MVNNLWMSWINGLKPVDIIDKFELQLMSNSSPRVSDVS